MTDPDQVLNPATGELVTFVRVEDELLVMEDYWPGADHVVARHVHPRIEERWQVLEGRVRFRIGDRDLVAGPGDVLIAAPGVAHGSENVSGGPARLRIVMRPALRWEEFVRRLFALAGGEGDGDAAALLAEFSDEIELA